ncbi:MAG: hypothetical protein V4490_04570, partial [Pseudomonadota bacterium]
KLKNRVKNSSAGLAILNMYVGNMNARAVRRNAPVIAADAKMGTDPENIKCFNPHIGEFKYVLREDLIKGLKAEQADPNKAQVYSFLLVGPKMQSASVWFSEVATTDTLPRRPRLSSV